MIETLWNYLAYK